MLEIAERAATTTAVRKEKASTHEPKRFLVLFCRLWMESVDSPSELRNSVQGWCLPSLSTLREEGRAHNPTEFAATTIPGDVEPLPDRWLQQGQRNGVRAQAAACEEKLLTFLARPVCELKAAATPGPLRAVI